MSRRANSANPAGAHAALTGAVIERIEAVYDKLGQPTYVRLPSLLDPGCDRLLQARGYKVRLRKLDPYLNVDPGTMSPFQHGEVFVTVDGAETDLDLGHYERFMDQETKKINNIIFSHSAILKSFTAAPLKLH